MKQARIPTAIHYTQQDVVTESFHFSELARQKLLADPGALEKLQQQTGLSDMYWKALYYQFPGDSKTLAQIQAEVDGYVFFIHGWDGSHRIWEDLPARLVGRHKNIVAFNLDVNGFGLSRFLNDTPTAEQCCPAALMAAVEHWLAAINLWPATGRDKKPFYLFVGHSMGGAALFYKDETGWRNEIYSFYALAPALLCNDTQRQNFYKTLGTGIRLPSFSAVKNALAPRIIDILGAGASMPVKQEHLRVYHQTSFGTLAQTFYAMGAVSEKPQPKNWSRFKVALGHRDRLVGLDNMLELLEELRFNPRQSQIALGSHYFFSYDKDSPPSHKDNRTMVLEDLVALCHKLAESAKGTASVVG